MDNALQPTPPLSLEELTAICLGLRDSLSAVHARLDVIEQGLMALQASMEYLTKHLITHKEGYLL